MNHPKYQLLTGGLDDSYARSPNGLPFDPWSYLGPKRRRLMEESWAGVFREHILRELPVHKIAPYFSEGCGRPTKELYAAMGSLILQQMHDLTDEETVDEFCFNIKWHYALDIPGESDESKYLSPKTLWRLRLSLIHISEPTRRTPISYAV